MLKNQFIVSLFLISLSMSFGVADESNFQEKKDHAMSFFSKRAKKTQIKLNTFRKAFQECKNNEVKCSRIDIMREEAKKSESEYKKDFGKMKCILSASDEDTLAKCNIDPLAIKN
ncbi:hypothetical protein N9N67_00695 [Bacteriovoracaceae bacterium]|nr:hypothetical protein [Bacteriovoracaceae bacterium]